MKKKKGQKKIYYRDCIVTFDIEASNVPELKQSFMYIWQMCFYWPDQHGTWHHREILGRTWDQFKHILKYMMDLNKPDEKWLIWIHNASYEFQFLAGILHFDEDDVFCVDIRRPIKFNIGENIECRCSYALTNLSLYNFTRQMNVKHKKLAGERFDYNKIRTPGMALPAYQIRYCINDVLGLAEAIRERLERYNDDLYHVPLTSTGYIRRVAKEELQSIRYMERIRWAPGWNIKDEDLKGKYMENVFSAEREGFRGGNVHANRFYAGAVIENVLSVDRSSSYIEVIVNGLFPKNGLSRIGPLSLERIKALTTNHRMGLLMRVSFLNLRLRSIYTSMPYLPTAKVLSGTITRKDNGRILKCDPRSWVDMTITDIDLRIILDQYDFDDFICVDSFGSVLAPLPEPIRNLAIKYYKAKTELKNVDEAFYLQAKELLNSLYGMMIQNPLRETVVFRNDDYAFKKEDDISRLKKHARSGFLSYQWGVWVTSLARFELYKGQKIIERFYKDSVIDRLAYMDTDSLKFICDSEEDVHMFDQYNNEKIELAKKTGAFAVDPKGITHYMGVFEQEGKPYSKFVTHGSKKYAYIQDGKLHLTCSGVPKLSGAYQLEQAGGIDFFQPGFVFTNAGLDVIYNDKVDLHTMINNEDIHITRNSYLYPGKYELNMETNYEKECEIAKNLLTNQNIDDIFDLDHNYDL